MARDIPPAILRAIAEGNGILFLGAGASYDALQESKPSRITADIVKETLSNKFLGGAFKDKSLMTVADLARNEDSLLNVQSTVREIFSRLEPNTFHLTVPQFRWKAIISTNYDLVVERTYKQTASRLQQLAPIAKNGPELQEALSRQNTVPYLKLHGCIDNYTDTTVPIVLDSLEYSKFSSGRENLVTALKEWAVNYPIIFCGYSLSDENIKQILFDIGDSSQVRPQYLYVSPGLTEIENRYWSGRRIAPYSGTYKELLEDLDKKIPIATRTLGSFFSKNELTISKWIPSHTEPSAALLQYLSEELIHVLPEAPASSKSDPQDFYSGLDVSFSPIYASLDVRRKIVDQLLNDVVLDTVKSTLPKFFVVLGYAGCGKSVLARRLAIESASLIDTPLVVYLPEGSVLRPNLLIELQKLVQSRLYIFIDDLFDLTDSLPDFLNTLRINSVPITVLACARSNEFSILGPKYAGKVSKEFEVGDLESQEVDSLLEKLSSHKLLGPLATYNESERALFIEKFYGRQLLVALHEITRGSSFEDIVIDEFEKITSRQAQQIYLDVCTLHQCRVGVRAGLVSRLNGLDISSLKTILENPLAKVIRYSYDNRYRDFVFRSRHEEISRMVFNLAIPSAEQRADQLRRILSKMDLDYSSDKRAFFELVKGRKLAEDFESKGLANSIFEAAEASNPPASYILHQRAILELSHKNGSLDVANDLLRRAEIEVRKEGFTDSSIQHTRANLLRKRANSTKMIVEKERFRAEARAILKPQLKRRGNLYPENLYGLLLLDEIRDDFEHKFDGHVKTTDSLATADPTVRLINELNTLLDKSLQQRPADGPMTLLKVEFLRALGKSPHAIGLLELYCEKNTASSSIIRVLAETLIEVERIDDAIKVLRPAVIATPGDRTLNLSLAKALIRQDEFGNSEAILTHLHRSFTEGDSNYEARFLSSRCNMLYGDLSLGKAEFKALQQHYIENREKPRALVLLADGSDRKYVGRISTKQHGFGFISSNDLRFDIFFSKKSTNTDNWDYLVKGCNVSFSLGFTFRGPIALDIAPLT